MRPSPIHTSTGVAAAVPQEEHSQPPATTGAGAEAGYSLGDAEMDHSHDEFMQLAQQAASAQPAEFAPALQQLLQHTQEHFEKEELRMHSSDHRLLNEHRAEHQRILGDMERFCQRARAGRSTMARAWVRDNLLDWFSAHVKTMDSALAAHLTDDSSDHG
ncbi:bacteriohemerythrin [Pseudomaricurvus sp. HS19]|uniref:bacteriohemerythrin n=1 Tax=Pseudomaricurvus sp. HS19 TaxID=2692626 RepID=UPI0013716F1A|nr:hemerythrin family protein [Pseudomaricurvus sp. HS19]MYM62499.1 hemerythrin HHE cation-binding protein [Pseudomaricurvus sp. HS19]